MPAIWFLELDLMAGRMVQSTHDLKNSTREDSISVLTDQVRKAHVIVKDTQVEHRPRLMCISCLKGYYYSKAVKLT